jgi:hypothetical protein
MIRAERKNAAEIKCVFCRPSNFGNGYREAKVFQHLMTGGGKLECNESDNVEQVQQIKPLYLITLHNERLPWH